MCQHSGSSSGSMSTRRRPGMTRDDVKLPLFHGNGTKDPEQYWFLCKAIWIVKKVQDEEINKGQLATTFQGQALDWYMKFVQLLIGHQQKTLV